MNRSKFLLVIWIAQSIAQGSTDEVISNNKGRYAYATIYYDAGPEEDGYMLAARVWARSLRKTGTKHDIVVIISNTARDSTQQILLADGCTVRRLDIEEPRVQEKVPAPSTGLVHHKNKLKIWNLDEYERVVYMEPHNIALHSMDSLFKCSSFCAVHNNPLIYVSSLWVITPKDKGTFTLVSDALSANSVVPGISQGFLPRLYSAIEAAPLFDDSDVTAESGQVRRLPFWYNINHFYYYERRNWKIYVCTEVNGTIPALSLSFQYSAPKMYPWYWMPYVYWNLHWEWHAMRADLNGDSSLPDMICHTFVLGILHAALLLKLLPSRILNWPGKFYKPKPVRLMKTPWFVWLLSYLGVVINFIVPIMIISPLLRPQFALLLYVAYNVTGLLIFAQLLLMVSGAASSRFGHAFYVEFLPSLLGMTILRVLVSDIYNHPVLAAVAPSLGLFCTLLVEARNLYCVLFTFSDKSKSTYR